MSHTQSGTMAASAIYGMNVPRPGFSRETGFGASITLMILAGLVLYVIFMRKNWL
jgi:magnesium transporter